MKGYTSVLLGVKGIKKTFDDRSFSCQYRRFSKLSNACDEYFVECDQNYVIPKYEISLNELNLLNFQSWTNKIENYGSKAHRTLGKHDTTWRGLPLPSTSYVSKNRTSWMDTTPTEPTRCHTHVHDKNHTQAIRYLENKC